MKKRTVLLIICILVVGVGAVLCINRCSNTETKQEKFVMEEIKATEDDSVITEVSELVSENQIEISNSIESKSVENQDENETKSIADSISDDVSESEGMLLDENETDKLVASGSIEKSEENLFGSNSGVSFKQDIQPTESSTDDFETFPVIPDDSMDQGEHESLPSAFELARDDSTLDYEYYLNVMTPEEKQKLYEAAPSPQAFMDWVSEMRDEYNENRKDKITNAEDGIIFD